MITLREATLEDAEEIAKINVESWQSTYRHILEDSYLDSLIWEDRMEKWKRLMEKKDVIILVAVNQNQIVGFLSGGKSEPYDAELFSIYLLSRFQRQGIGEKLFLAFEEWVRGNGFHSFVVWVAEKSPYKDFYVKMKGTLTDLLKKHKFGNREIDIIAYEWHLKEK